MLRLLKKLFGIDETRGMPSPGALGIDELVRRLGMPEKQLRSVPLEYASFHVPKRSGGTRTIQALNAGLKAVQRLILHRLLRRLRAHPCATGFERGHSIVSNALPHVGQDVVIKLDLKDYFSSTTAARVESYFRRIGWNADTAALLTRLCTLQGSLPQGAPTSPRLSNLVNWRANLPRTTRRRLRAIEHRLRTRGVATISPQQLAGWRALQTMISAQSQG